MSSLDDERSVETAGDALRMLVRKRVQLWSERGELHYRAPRGALGPAEIAKLRSFGRQIVALLECSAGRHGSDPRLEPRRPTDRVPLTFSQLKYWHAERLGERTAMRSVAAAVRLCGSVDARLLQESVTAVVSRHEALRTRIVTDGSPLQEVALYGADQLRMDDLSGLPQETRAASVERSIHELMLEPVSVASGPLFAAQLLKLGETQHVLVVTMEHIISDGFSLGVLLRDLLALYRQAARRELPSFPAVPMQLADYAVWQAKAQPCWIRRHGAYWAQRLAGCGRLRLPGHEGTAANGCPWTVVPVRIERDMRQAFSEACRARRTTLVMAMFTAFVALVLRTYQVREGIVRYQTDGRFSPLLERAIGYFASVLNLRMELRDEDTFVDLLARVTHEYCTASEHADFSYVDAQVPAAPFTGNPAFNWIPRARDAFGTVDGTHEVLTVRPVKFALPTIQLEGYEWDHEPIVTLFDDSGVIEGRVIFASSTSVARMEAFRDNLLLLVAELLRCPEQRVRDVGLRESPVVP